MKKLYATYSYDDIHASEDECRLVLKFETEEDRDMVIEAVEDPE